MAQNPRAIMAPLSVRTLCAPAVPLADEVAAELASMKAKVAEPVAVGYTPDAFSKALEAGTVDTSLLSSTMDFSDEARKLAMKLNTEMSSMKNEMDKSTETDFTSWEGKLDSSVIAEVTAIYKSALEGVGDTSNPEIDALEKEVTAMFSGSGGLLELAAKEEKASEAGMLQCIADMEKIAVDVAGVSSVTIGEILDREPELRAQIEEDIKNNVWAP